MRAMHSTQAEASLVGQEPAAGRAQRRSWGVVAGRERATGGAAPAAEIACCRSAARWLTIAETEANSLRTSGATFFNFAARRCMPGPFDSAACDTRATNAADSSKFTSAALPTSG